MKKVPIAIAFVSLYLLFYQATPYIGIPDTAIITMFIISPFLVVTMVYIILKYGEPSKFTFDEKFYDDLDYKRNGKEELPP
jgi:hypothetical protein